MYMYVCECTVCQYVYIWQYMCVYICIFVFAVNNSTFQRKTVDFFEIFTHVPSPLPRLRCWSSVFISGTMCYPGKLPHRQTARWDFVSTTSQPSASPARSNRSNPPWQSKQSEIMGMMRKSYFHVIHSLQILQHPGVFTHWHSREAKLF